MCLSICVVFIFDIVVFVLQGRAEFYNWVNWAWDKIMHKQPEWGGLANDKGRIVIFQNFPSIWRMN